MSVHILNRCCSHSLYHLKQTFHPSCLHLWDYLFNYSAHDVNIVFLGLNRVNNGKPMMVADDGVRWWPEIVRVRDGDDDGVFYQEYEGK